MGSGLSKPTVDNTSYNPSPGQLCQICSRIDFASDGIHHLSMKKIVEGPTIILEDNRDNCSLCSWIRTTVDDRADKQYLFEKSLYTITITKHDSSLTIKFDSPGPVFTLELFWVRCMFLTYKSCL